MTGYLLDTNIALLALALPERIAPDVRRKLERGTIHLSVISYWEVVLKSSKGKLSIGDPRAWWTEALAHLGAISLPFKADHVSEIASLAPIHQDPFDRALIAQATVEGLTLATTDGEIGKYASARFRVVL